MAYGRDGKLPETRDALLCSQLQEGLRDRLMEGSTISGAANYQGLRIAAKNELKNVEDCPEKACSTFWYAVGPILVWSLVGIQKYSTREHGRDPSFLLFGMDCRSPTEAALLPPTRLEPTEVPCHVVPDFGQL